jgi:hypothetical protein
MAQWFYMSAMQLERCEFYYNSKQTVREFLQKHLKEGQTVRTDAFPALDSVSERHDHQKKVVPKLAANC